MKAVHQQTLLFTAILLQQTVMGAYKVFNGDPVTDWSATEFKFMVFLFDPKKCTGSWIGGNKVLTAAHCTCRNNPVKKALFERTTKDAPATEVIKIDSEDHSKHYKICKVFSNPDNYRGVDIGVGVLKSVPVSKRIAKLPIELKSDPSVGTIVSIAGYGEDEKGKHGSLKVGKARVVACPPKYLPFPICLEPVKEHRHQKTTPGDSGSPLLCKQGSAYYGCGVLNGHEESSARPDHYTMIFASNTFNKNFVKEHLKKSL